jgi:hypothetical protein
LSSPPSQSRRYRPARAVGPVPVPAAYQAEFSSQEAIDAVVNAANRTMVLVSGGSRVEEIRLALFSALLRRAGELTAEGYRARGGTCGPDRGRYRGRCWRYAHRMPDEGAAAGRQRGGRRAIRPTVAKTGTCRHGTPATMGHARRSVIRAHDPREGVR